MSKELIEQLAKDVDAFVHCDGNIFFTNHKQLEAMCKAYVQTQGQSNWISVKDRLPNDGDFIYGANAGGGVWRECFDSAEPLGSMAYWMVSPPLPAAPIESGVKGIRRGGISKV
jgi:hypothetical protein